MLEITMPTSFDPRLLDELEALNVRYAERGVRVTELFGSLDRSVVGSGRPSRSLPPIDRAGFEAHARDLIGRGFHLTYLYNGSCTGNREHSPELRARLLDEIDWVRGLGTRSVVVASPYLVDLLRQRAPELRVHLSSVAFAKSTKEVAHHVRQGITRLILDPDSVRDLGFTERVRAEWPDLEIEALVNHPCLMNCPYETYCYNTVSHGSADGGAPAHAGTHHPDDEAPFAHYALLRCNLDKLRDPAELVRGSWVRPQDTHHLERAGVTVLKLAGRGRTTDWLLRTAEAYLAREFSGNLMDLIWEAQWAAVRRMIERPDLGTLPVDVPAVAFEGFMETFARVRPTCREGCGTCRICPGFARRGVTIEPRLRAAYAEAIEATLERLTADPRR
jgi:collagenase-like PrtC family protease